MLNKKTLLIVFFLSVLNSLASALPYQELAPNFNRIKSNVMIRLIAKPTVANLDFAAYNANPVRFNPEKFKPKRPKGKVRWGDLTFGGHLSSVCNSLSETPLTGEEKEAPLAWLPLKNNLWEILEKDDFNQIGSKINGEKWGDPSIFRPYQEVVTAYLHQNDQVSEMWVKIEFAHWVKFLKFVSDEDGDGIREIYGKLNLDSIENSVKQKAFSWIQLDYLKKELNREEIVDWINVLASYWYPSLNTDLIDMTGETQWPTKDTEKKVKKRLKGVVVNNPIAVIRGNPFKKPIYNIYVLKEEMPDAQEVEMPIPNLLSTAKILDNTVSKNFRENNIRFENEIKQNGDYLAWAKKHHPFLNDLKKHMAALPKEQLGLKGKKDWLFFGKSIRYMVGGDLTKQSPDKNPLPYLTEFKKYLDGQNVNLLFVVVPTKSEMYYEYLPVEVPQGINPLVNPYSRKFLKDVQTAGIEVIDLWPHYLKAKKQDRSTGELLYQRHDTHWTNRGLQIAAALIAKRIKSYQWYGQLAENRIGYQVKDTTFMRRGDIVERIAQADQTDYLPQKLKAHQIYSPAGKRYRGNRNAPIMLIGDSFTGVFELVDCKSAGIGANVAEKTGIPVDIITSWGGGPLVRQKMIRARKKDMGKKRLVIYLMVARDLYNYSQSWKPIVVN